MPMPSEHTARQRSAAGFERIRRGRRPNWPEGVSAVFGFGPGKRSAILSIRFARTLWTPARAKAWLVANGFSTRAFEAATSVKKATGAPRPVKLIKTAHTDDVAGDAAGDERYVLGIVLEPDTTDAQGDIYDATEVRKAAHFYMECHQQLKLMHDKTLDNRAAVLESYLAPVDLSIEGRFIPRGTWLLAARVPKDLWPAVKSGQLDGWSIGGVGTRESVA